VTGWYVGGHGPVVDRLCAAKVFGRRPKPAWYVMNCAASVHRTPKIIDIEAAQDDFFSGLVTAAPDRDPLPRCYASRVNLDRHWRFPAGKATLPPRALQMLAGSRPNQRIGRRGDHSIT